MNTELNCRSFDILVNDEVPTNANIARSGKIIQTVTAKSKDKAIELAKSTIDKKIAKVEEGGLRVFGS